jgi:glyoxylase-like metal-dependent hydrolase (beta-lactamase superfamily II)
MSSRTPWTPIALLALLAACAEDPQSDGTAAAETAQAAPRLVEADGTLRSETHVFEELAPGVYFASGTGIVNVASNALVVVNDEDVLVVDSHITPDAARTLLESVRALTDRPLRYLVNSHFHFDHAHGNQAFPEGIEIIGHEFTREKLLGEVLAEPTAQTIGGPASVERQIAAIEAQLAAATETGARAGLEAQLAMQRRHLGAIAEVRPTPPNLTLTDKLTLFRGGREIQLLHLGRGHTGGDVVVYLPAEKIAFTGDLFYGGAPYLGDSYPQDFVTTLEALKALDAAVLVGGHGPPVRDRAVLDLAQQYLRAYWDQVAGFHARGLSVEDAVSRLDLSGYERWAAFQLGNPEVLRLEVTRIYHLLDGGD